MQEDINEVFYARYANKVENGRMPGFVGLLMTNGYTKHA
jgi:hypothetical protein